MTSTQLQNLPQSILVEIMKFLDQRSVLNISESSSLLRNLVFSVDIPCWRKAVISNYKKLQYSSSLHVLATRIRELVLPQMPGPKAVTYMLQKLPVQPQVTTLALHVGILIYRQDHLVALGQKVPNVKHLTLKCYNCSPELTVYETMLTVWPDIQTFKQILEQENAFRLNTQVGNGNLAQLVKQMKNLQSLEVRSDSHFWGNIITALINSTNAGHLMEMRFQELHRNRYAVMPDDTFSNLNRLSVLETFVIDGCSVGPTNFLKPLRYLSTLKHLHMPQGSYSEHDLIDFFSHATFQLQRLKLESSGEMTDAVLEAISLAQSNLQIFSIYTAAPGDTSTVTDQGMRHICSLSGLRMLHSYSPAVTGEFLDSLQPHLQLELVVLSFIPHIGTRGKLDFATMEEVFRRFPNCQFVTSGNNHKIDERLRIDYNDNGTECCMHLVRPK